MQIHIVRMRQESANKVEEKVGGFVVARTVSVLPILQNTPDIMEGFVEFPAATVGVEECQYVNDHNVVDSSSAFIEVCLVSACLEQ